MRYIKSLLLGVGVVIITALGCDVIQSNKNVPSNIEESGETLLPKIQKDKFILNFFGDDEPKKKTGNASVSWDEIESVIEIAQEQTGEELIAVFSVRDSTGEWYNYYLQPLGFSPEAMEEAQGETQLFVYELEPDTLGSISRIAVAQIPAGELASNDMEEWILPNVTTKAKINSSLAISNNCTSVMVAPAAKACFGDTGEFCTHYPPIYELVCEGPPSGNDDGGDGPNWDWPYSGGGSGPSNGGDGSGNPDECRPPYGCNNEGEVEPCETGIEEIDSPLVQQGLEELWNDSNYETNGNPNPESQRKEQVGFIVPLGNDFSFQKLHHTKIVAQTPCEVVFNVSNIPEGAIIVHTHPYNNLENQNHCKQGQTYTYSSIPVREVDKNTLEKLELDQGITIDNENIVFFNRNGEIEYLIRRCGY